MSAHHPGPSRRVLAVLVAACALTAGRPADAEDRVSVRAAYFREASTRVVQPMLEVTKDLPRGYDVNAHFAVDAISSPSIAQGATSDKVFTERRYEGSLAVGKAWGHTRLGGFARYSYEPDYRSTGGGLSLSHDVWGNTGTIAASVAFTHDDIQPKGPANPKDLDVYYAGVSYTQVLTPTTIAQAGYELFYQDGFFANAYLSSELGRENVPTQRLRHAAAVRVGQYVPPIGLGVQLHYRLYFDQDAGPRIGPWGMTGHTFHARLYKELGRDFEVRLDYRHHRQSGARFWCDLRAEPGCYGPLATFHSFDPKFGNLWTNLVDVKVIWDLRALAGLDPLLHFLSAGSFDVSYGYYFESAYYGQKFEDKNAPPAIGELWFTRKHGGAHVIQTGYSVPF